MRFEQTRTILQKLAPGYHLKVRDYFRQFGEGEVSPRVRMMLDYLIDHEEQRARALSEFCETAPKKLLEHWLKGLEVEFPQLVDNLLDDGCRYDLNELIRVAVTYKQALIDYYQYAFEHSADAKTSSMFEQLKDQEEKAMKRLIRHAQGLADL